MTRIYEISDQLVEKIASIHPIAATSLGIPGYEKELGDFSPDGISESANLARNTLTKLKDVPIENDADRRAKEVMEEDLKADVDSYERGEPFRKLNILSSPLQNIRMVFDYMPQESTEDWENIASRLSKVPDALNGYKETLRHGINEDLVSTKRQTSECSKQALTHSGRTHSTSFFTDLLDSFNQSNISSESLGSDIKTGVESAMNAFVNFSEFLASEYIGHASSQVGVAEER